ncbi:chromate transporter [Mycobacterium sp. 236(2023)]|uniref:chromate transporter n=1 Tax=Mycobacterium sp. 236(2023) TaxID=3038163 RepID=UPI00241527AB|nr:chromate transporter [Mycobacterium sp. 236(2023)]MDG4665686.1 chromate transporter [Mycobacterium sp. 236(2023)]
MIAHLDTYLQLALLFGGLSLMSIGGGNVVLPEMHLRSVQDHHWLTNTQFAEVFSISQTMPGPSSVLIVTLVGYGAGHDVGGVLGAIVGGLISIVAMVVPAAGVTFFVTRFWQRAHEAPWHAAVEKGLAPMAVGLIMATALVMSRAADHDWRSYLLTALCTVVFVATKLNPLWLVALAAVLGYVGVL